MDWKRFPIHRQEAMYMGIAMGFAGIWFFVLMPIVTGAWGTDFAILQFLLFNVGSYAFFFIFLKSFITKTDVNLKSSLGLLFLFMGIDMLMPEYHVGLDGVLSTGAAMGVSSSDYIVGLLGKTIGIPGIGLALWTYMLFPFVFLLIAAKLIPNFLKKL